MIVKEVRVIRHGIRWIMGGEELKCPECNTRNESQLEFGTRDIKYIRNEKNEHIGVSVSINCSNCFCVFKCKRYFKEDSK